MFSAFLLLILLSVLTSAHLLAPGNPVLLTTVSSVLSSSDCRTLTMAEAMVKKLQSEFWGLQKERINVRFFTSCISEGLIPNGMKSSFNLAMDVNNKVLVDNIQNSLNYQASRILDTVKETSENNFIQLEEAFENLKEEVMISFGEQDGKRKLVEAKRNMAWKAQIIFILYSSND